MRPLSASQLIDVWERGSGLPPVRQALLLLHAACPDEPPEALAALHVGRRDARLLRLRTLTMGPRLDCEAACPACAERLEFSLQADDLGAAAAPPADTPLSLELQGYALLFRLPNSQDLMVAAGQNPHEAERQILRRCLVQAVHAGENVMLDDLPDKVLAAMSRRMAEADELADMRFDLTCPACDHAWQAPFDIVAYFWRELEEGVQRLLHEAHRLAAAYGWREADILAMSPWRRQQYLNFLST